MNRNLAEGIPASLAGAASDPAQVTYPEASAAVACLDAADSAAVAAPAAAAEEAARTCPAVTHKGLGFADPDLAWEAAARACLAASSQGAAAAAAAVAGVAGLPSQVFVAVAVVAAAEG